MLRLWLTCSITLVALGCTTETGPNDEGPLRIAALGPLSHEFFSRALEGAALAVAVVNETGGIRGRQVELSLKDTRSQPMAAQDVAREALEEGAVGFVGPVFPSPAEAVVEMTNAAGGFPLVTFQGGSSPRWTTLQPPEERTAFSLLSTYCTDTFAAIEHWATADRCTSVAVIADTLSHPDCYEAALQDLLEDRGIEYAGSAYVPIGSFDFSIAIEPLVPQEPDCVTLGVLGGFMERLVGAWRSASSSPDDPTWIATTRGARDVSMPNGLLGGGGVGDLDLLVAEQPQAAAFDPFHFSLFEEQYQATFGHSNYTPLAARAYDATMLLLIGLSSPGGVDPITFHNTVLRASRYDGGNREILMPAFDVRRGFDAISDGSDVNYDGISGPVELKANGWARSKFEYYRLYTNEDGQPVVEDLVQGHTDFVPQGVADL